ncbi:microtubule cross-linking factor 2 [Trichomycterus rosablanca]|uniref:microtubule cross-linking factor 2 n=1 Tax=Trichomycterus rosablanca TaxID=2290929 RepID=UPI002F3509FC
MTKTKVDAGSPTHFVSAKEKRLRSKMETESGPEAGAVVQAPPIEKKKPHRAPSPARPKDVPGWSITKIRGGIGAPTLSVKPGAIHLGSRVSRRSPASGKDTKGERVGKAVGRSALAALTAQKSSLKSNKAARRKVSDASIASDDLSKDSGKESGKLSPTDSSSELSDCASEENKLFMDALSSDTETSSRGGAAESEKGRNVLGENQAKTNVRRLSLEVDAGQDSMSPGDERSFTSLDSRMPASTSLAFSDLTEELTEGIHEEYLREIEELRSENDYLKDEVEELRSEMLEMRDMYMEEDVYQLQELRQQLEQSNKTCRILQYRLRKAERRSLRVAQTGQVDGELIRTLEQDVKVTKDVSIRLHNELEAVEKKRTHLEQENEELQVKLQDLEVAKQVLQAELEKSRELNTDLRAGQGKIQNFSASSGLASSVTTQLREVRMRGDRTYSELLMLFSSLLRSDNSDILVGSTQNWSPLDVGNSVFTRGSKISSRLLCNSLKKRSARPNNKPEKKMSPQPPEDSSDLKCQLHFAKEESALMCKKLTKMVKDNETMKEELAKYHSLYGDVDTSLTIEEVADSPHTREAEVRAHLKLVEEEANLLSRRIVELEVENRGLHAEMDDLKIQETPGGMTHTTGVGQLLLSPSAESVMEMQRHLQFVEEEAELLRRSLIEMEEQNKLLMNELNRFKSEIPSSADIESSLPSTILPPFIVPKITNPEEDILNEASHEELLAARLQISDLSGKVQKLQYENRILLSNLQSCNLVSRHMESQQAMETDAEAIDSDEYVSNPEQHKGPIGGEGNQFLEDKCEKLTGNNHFVSEQCLSIKELLAIRDQAQLVTSAIQLLTSAKSNCLTSSLDSMLHKITNGADAEVGLLEKSQEHSYYLALVEALHSKLQFLQAQLQVLNQKMEGLGESLEKKQNEEIIPMPPCAADTQVNQITAQQNLLEQVKDLQAQLCEAKEKAKKAQEEFALESQVHQDYTQSCSKKLSQLHEEHQKMLVHRNFQLQSVSLQTRLQQKFWSQEKNVLLQESQQLKQCLRLVSLKLRWLLKQWKLGKQMDTEGKGMLEINSIKDLHLPLKDDGLAPHHGDKKLTAAEEQQPSLTSINHTLPENIHLQQSSDLNETLSDLKLALQDLSTELQEESQGFQELTQQFARAKASWEVERTELKSYITQLEGKAPKTNAAATNKDAPDLKAMKREREEHKHLLADSYAAVMDLTKQLQISERNWSREKLELLERFNQERNQWEQRLCDVQNKDAQVLDDKDSCATTNRTMLGSQTISPLSDLKSLLDTNSFLPGQEINGIPEEKAVKPQLIGLTAQTDLVDLNHKNWKYLSNEMAYLEKPEPFKTWDCPSASLPELKLSVDNVQRSYTAPDKTGIRIYYSPPTIRRIERKTAKESVSEQVQPGLKSQGAIIPEQVGLAFAAPSSSLPSLSSYEHWLSSLSQQRRDLLKGRAGSSGPFHTLEISANLSDDMKEMTNCVRQAIRSSSLERKCSKDTGSQTVGFTSTGTQTAQFVSVGLQTEGPVSLTSRGAGLHGKIWSPRPSTSLSSARSRQISTSLEKVHNRIDRPCCSPKYGSPKLTRRVSTSSSKLETSSTSSRDRNAWNLSNRGITQNGSAWARSTTTRDSPVLSGLNDGLSSLFNVVEHTSSMESLWRGDTCPGKQAAGKPSCPSVRFGVGDPATHKYGIVQEFFQNVCGRTEPAEKTGAIDEPKPECLSGYLIGTDSITRIVNKRFMRQTQREDTVVSASSLEDSCECAPQSPTSCFTRTSRSTVHLTHSQCKHHVQESANEERLDPSNGKE